MFRILLATAVSAYSITLFAQASGTPEEKAAYRVAKLFFAARVSIGERTAFTDNPKNSKNDKKSIMETIANTYELMAKEKLNVNSDPHTSVMWQAINAVVNKATDGGYEGQWADQKVAPGKIVPARFGNEITKEYNTLSKNSKINWTTSDEYLVNPKSKADDWEQMAIKNKFKTSQWTVGNPFSEVLQENGKNYFRYAQPEYFKSSCLNCHGGEMGKSLHIGKGSAMAGAFGGLLSVKMDK